MLPVCLCIISNVPEQNPYGNQGPVIGKAMVVCPVSLVEVSLPHFSLRLSHSDRIGERNSTNGECTNPKHCLVLTFAKDWP